MFAKQLLYLLLWASLLHTSCSQKIISTLSDDMTFITLLCNSAVSPTSIESEQPYFSWIVQAQGFNKSQSAYQVLVASALDQLDDSHADLWNSGKVQSDQSTHVVYQGSKLMPLQSYYWKVKIWDESGQESVWSKPETFRMGIMDETNWAGAQWISLNNDSRTSPHRFREYKTSRMEEPMMVEGQAAGYFRKIIDAKQDIKSAQAYICGLGYYELFLNGEKVGDHVLDPAPSNYDKQAYYVHYDVTGQINPGQNAIGIAMGNGFYGQDISWKSDPESENDLSFGPPTVRLLIKLTYSDGSTADIYTDDTWVESTGPTVFNNIYGGETYDANFEIDGWQTVSYDASQWGKPKVVSPRLDKISAQQIPPIRKLKTFDPMRVFRAPDGNWIVDFGQNIAGWVKISVDEEAGQLVEITTTEALTQDGTDIFQGATGGGANGMPQIYKYVCKGSGIESWEPKFSYHGFRYAKISGVSKQPDKDMIKAVLVATDIEEKGRFSSSDSLLNKMHSISKWTIVSNIHGIPEDCPHREKCGWLGDAHAFCEYALYNYDMDNFYKKYMVDIRTQMRPANGHNNPEIEYKVPTMIAPGKRTSSIAKLDWGIATIYLPWYNYLYYGDETIVKDYYDEMKGLTEYYLSFKDVDGIIKNGMGDWCPPRWDRRGNPSAMECDPIVSANAYFYDILGIMENFADMSHDITFAAEMEQEKNELKAAFNEAYLTSIPDTKYKWYGSQTATVMALQFGMVPTHEMASVINGLAHDIRVVKRGHHATGIHGNRYIYTVLTEYGMSDLAYDILTTPEFPSQTYVMNYGFTTWPERQFEWAKMDGLTNSLNHPMHSGFAAYFFESLGGIKPVYRAPGFKSFNVDPIFPSAITHAAIDIPTPYGQIQNSWKLEEGEYFMNLVVPFNTTANVQLSLEERSTLYINGKSWSDFQKILSLADSKNSTISLGSGSYHLKFVKEK